MNIFLGNFLRLPELKLSLSLPGKVNRRLHCRFLVAEAVSNSSSVVRFIIRKD